MNSLLSIVRWCCPERMKQDAISWIGFLQEFQYGNVSPDHNKQKRMVRIHIRCLFYKTGSRGRSWYLRLFGYGKTIKVTISICKNCGVETTLKNVLRMLDITITLLALVTQLVEYIPFKDGVVGSNPTERTIINLKLY